MTPKAIAFAIALALSAALHAFVPSLEKPIYGLIIAALGLAAVLLVRNAKDVAWIQALEDAFTQQQDGGAQLAKLRLQKKPRKLLGLFVLVLALLLLGTGCISSAPIVPVTGAVAGALVIAGTAIAGLTSSNFANSHCSDVVGALPLAASKKAEGK